MTGSATDEDDLWDRKHGSGLPSTSQTQAEVLGQSPEGREKLASIRHTLETAAQRKAQVWRCIALDTFTSTNM